LKKELVPGTDFATRAQARAAIVEYIEVFYNCQRRHSSLGYVSPAECEQREESETRVHFSWGTPRDQGVGGEERTDEQRPDPRVAGTEPDEQSRREGKGKGEQPEPDGPVPGAVELDEVNLHPGEEHQQELAEFREEVGDLPVPGRDLQPVWADQDPGGQ
jgi:hypothetical protein